MIKKQKDKMWYLIMVYSSAQRGDSVKKKESVLICDKNKEIEYLWDGPIIE